MAMITLKEFAERNGKHRSNALQKLGRGAFPTARKIGNQWFVDENEKWVDGRVKSGAYCGWRSSFKAGEQPEDEPQKVDYELKSE